MQTDGIELESPERVETGIGDEGQGQGEGDDAIVDSQDTEQYPVLPPNGDNCDEEGDDEQVETGREVECESMTKDIPYVAHGERMAIAICPHANATVPKVNVVIGKAYGSAYTIMNSKAIGCDITIAWPNAEIGTMDSKLAAKIMYSDSDVDTQNQKAEEYAKLQNNVVSAAKRGYVDQIVEPADTRKYVIGAFEMLYSKMEDRPAKKHGTI